MGAGVVVVVGVSVEGDGVGGVRECSHTSLEFPLEFSLEFALEFPPEFLTEFTLGSCGTSPPPPIQSPTMTRGNSKCQIASRN